MIDAYEIGIQLLLQDDVSAGLAVINRGLAEVDRAIAATSAQLAELIPEAARAAKAVATAVGGRVPQVGASEPRNVIAPGDAVERPVKEALPSGNAAAPVDAGNQRREGSSATPAAAVRTESIQSPQLSPAVSGVERVINASAPAQTVRSETERQEARENGRLASTAGAPAVTRADSATSRRDAPGRRDGGDMTRAPETRASSTAPRSTVALTATVGQSRAASSSGAKRDRVRAQTTDQHPAERERVATAPWSAGADATQQSAPVRPAERAAAPQAPSRERADGGGGTVMLDGRLVGQWLSEHMGREASRPPGGTSFFDARQTPAWNVSGAL